MKIANAFFISEVFVSVKPQLKIFVIDRIVIWQLYLIFVDE